MEAAMDRYSKTVLTVIAGALVYLCIVMTAFPTVHAQQTAARPGEMTGPAQVVVVGWNPGATVPITTAQPLSIVAAQPLPIVAAQPLHVVTERSTGVPDRMLLVGWEENATRDHAGNVHVLTSANAGIPVVVHPK
jgi:hypothetical protein